jgi:hypothetical protein
MKLAIGNTPATNHILLFPVKHQDHHYQDRVLVESSEELLYSRCYHRITNQIQSSNAAFSHFLNSFINDGCCRLPTLSLDSEVGFSRIHLFLPCLFCSIHLSLSLIPLSLISDSSHLLSPPRLSPSRLSPLRLSLRLRGNNGLLEV